MKKEPVARGKADKGRTEDTKESVKSVLLKGKAPVDPECTAKVGKAHVYFEGNDVYDVMLNQVRGKTILFMALSSWSLLMIEHPRSLMLC